MAPKPALAGLPGQVPVNTTLPAPPGQGLHPAAPRPATSQAQPLEGTQ